MPKMWLLLESKCGANTFDRSVDICATRIIKAVGREVRLAAAVGDPAVTAGRGGREKWRGRERGRNGGGERERGRF